MLKRLLYLIVTANFFLPEVYGQDVPEEGSGEIEERQVVIDKNLEIELPEADRNFEKVPPPPVIQSTSENLNYDVSYVDNSIIPDLTPTLRVLKIKTERPPQLYGNYVKVGIGNYISPYLALYFNNVQSNSLSYGASAFHHSALKGPVDGRNSGDGQSELRLFGKYMTNNATVGGSIGYNLDAYHFYGYDDGIEVDRDTLRQVFNTFKIGTTIENSNPDSDLDLKAEIKYAYKGDKFDASENMFNANIFGYYPVTEDIGAGMDVEFDYRSYNNVLKANRNLLSFNPYATIEEGLWKIKAGFRVISNSDDRDNVRKISIFPAVTADYYLSDNLIAFALFDGNVDKVNFISITEANPYIAQNTPIFNTIKNLELGGGIRGTVLNNLGYKALLTFSGYKNMYFFVNDSVETNKFNVIYDDDNTTLLKFQGFLNYTIAKKYGAELSFKYFGYGTGDLEEAWHRPKLDMGISGWYNIFEKIIVSTDFRVLSGIKALDPNTLETISLSSSLDLNAEINYKFSERAGAFIMLNNLLGKKYETLYRYPVRGLQVTAGVNFSF